ncbi:MAG: cell division topological specificity factor MinE [Desulfurellaceae bacterium]|jgi:cell division topological specificity factor|nr:cell division topological specificity factor MinE [Desulfurellaceae bacterium]
MILDFLLKKKEKSSKVARERLQIVLAHERTLNIPFMENLKKDLLQVIAKYVDIDKENIEVKMNRLDNMEILDINIPLKQR